MRKILLASLCGLTLFAGNALAAKGKECSYSPLQQLIRNARDASEISELINNQVNLNIKPRCGGNVLQLAILRGNPEVMRVLLDADMLSLNDKVSIVDYPIPGAPKEIPLAFFAAYYSPRADIMSLLIEAGANVMGTDDRGETILWYLNQNPVLMNTQLVDDLTNQLLMDPSVNGAQENVKKGKFIKNNKKSDKSDKDKKEKKEPVNAVSSGFDVIETEPDNAYNPQRDSQIDL